MFKQFSALAIICIPFLSINSVHAQKLIITDEELARVVCNYVKSEAELKTAVVKAYSETREIIDEYQQDTLRQLVTEEVNVSSYCAQIKN